MTLLTQHMPEGERISARMKGLEEERARGWDTHWMDLQDYILPRKGFFPSYGHEANDGKKRSEKIIDGTATRAVERLRAAIHGGMTSPTRRWFRMAYQDEALKEAHAAKEWLFECQDRLYAGLRSSNFYGAMSSSDEEAIVFGSAPMIIDPHPRNVFSFRSLTAGSFCLIQDANGEICGVYRRDLPTVQALMNKFGERCSGEIKSQYNVNPDDNYPIIHAIVKNERFSPEKIGIDGRPWTSIYVDGKGSHEVIGKEGHNEQPFVVFRWDVRANDVYGISPCMNILGDVQMLQQMASDLLLAEQKVLSPPMNVPEGSSLDVQSFPDALNPVPTNSQGVLTPTYQIRPDLVAMSAQIASTQQAIREGLYNNLFFSIEEPTGITATEVIQRQNEKLLLLGPVVERAEQSLDILLRRCFNMMERRGLFPPAPPEVEERGMDIKIEYTSMMSQAQQMLAASTAQAVREFIAQSATISPEVVDLYDADAAARNYADILGVSPEHLRSDEEVKALREARKAKQQAQEQMAMAEQAVKATKALSETTTEGPSALSAIMGGM